jgi:hypothetical protein
MNTITVGAMALIAGVGLGVSVTSTIRTQNVQAEILSALRTFDEERRQRDADEKTATSQQQIEQTNKLWSDAMKGWGETGGKVK